MYNIQTVKAKQTVIRQNWKVRVCMILLYKAGLQVSLLVWRKIFHIGETNMCMVLKWRILFMPKILSKPRSGEEKILGPSRDPPKRN